MLALIFSAILPILGLGDSIMAGYCNPNPAQTQFGYLVAKHYGTTFQDLGQDGRLAEDVIKYQLPLATGQYSAVLISVGTNDENDSFNKTNVSSQDYLIQENILLHKLVRQRWPNAKIVDVGVRDFGYLQTGMSSLEKMELASQIGQYDSAVSAWVLAQPGEGYLPLYPAVASYPYEITYPAYYTTAATCGPMHPSVLGEQAIAVGIESILTHI